MHDSCLIRKRLNLACNRLRSNCNLSHRWRWRIKQYGRRFNKAVLRDMQVSDICLGTMQFGERLDYLESLKLLDIGFENGINFFDTAEMYPVPQKAETRGLSESWLGEWLQHHKREDIIISTKVTGPSGQMTYIREGPVALDRGNIKQAVEGSLKRLRTDYIDLYTLHWPDRYVPMFGESEYDPSQAYSSSDINEQYEALIELQNEGKIRHFALSNETPYGVMRFSEAARKQGKEGVAAIQNAYSLVCRTFDSGLAECCHREEISLLAYSPLAMGLLTGKYCDSEKTPEDARLKMYKGRYAEAESRYGPKPNLYEAVQQYCDLAKEAGLPPYELALRFVLGRPLVASAIIGSTKPSQLKDLVKARAYGDLPEDILNAIDRVHARFPNPAP